MLLLIQNCRFCGLVKRAPKGPNVKGLVPSVDAADKQWNHQEVELSGVEVGHRDITLKWKTGPHLSLFCCLVAMKQAVSFATRPWPDGLHQSSTASQSVYDNLSLHSVLTAHPQGILTPSCGVYLSQMPGYPQSSNVFIASLTQKPQSLLCSLSLY